MDSEGPFSTPMRLKLKGSIFFEFIAFSWIESREKQLDEELESSFEFFNFCDCFFFFHSGSNLSWTFELKLVYSNCCKFMICLFSSFILRYSDST